MWMTTRAPAQLYCRSFAKLAMRVKRTLGCISAAAASSQYSLLGAQLGKKLFALYFQFTSSSSIFFLLFISALTFNMFEIQSCKYLCTFIYSPFFALPIHELMRTSYCFSSSSLSLSLCVYFFLSRSYQS